jgi:hypothetical protein
MYPEVCQQLNIKIIFPQIEELENQLESLLSYSLDLLSQTVKSQIIDSEHLLSSFLRLLDAQVQFFAEVLLDTSRCASMMKQFAVFALFNSIGDTCNLRSSKSEDFQTSLRKATAKLVPEFPEAGSIFVRSYFVFC